MNKAQEKTDRDVVAMKGPGGAAIMSSPRAAFSRGNARPHDMLEDTMSVVAFLREAVTTVHQGAYGIQLSESAALGFAFILDEVNNNLELAWRELANRGREE